MLTCAGRHARLAHDLRRALVSLDITPSPAGTSRGYRTAVARRDAGPRKFARSHGASDDEREPPSTSTSSSTSFHHHHDTKHTSASAPRKRNWRIPLAHPLPEPIAADARPEDSFRTFLQRGRPSTESPLFSDAAVGSSDAGELREQEEEGVSEDELDHEKRSVERPGWARRKVLKPTSAHQHQVHQARMHDIFPKGQNGVSWSPPRKLSRAAMDGLRALHAHDPALFSTPALASKFQISPEAVRRILKSSWKPSHEDRIRLAEREKRLATERIQKRREVEREERAKWDVADGSGRDRLTMV